MLTGLSWLYGKIIDSRNSLYSNGALKAERLPGVTISVGNITVGGTGKTPLVEYAARHYAERGEAVCIISRGYKRNDESKRVLVCNTTELLAGHLDAGDEPYELAMRLLGKAVIISDSDRVAAARWAKAEFGISVFLLDDAFQHRRAERDLDIVVVDGTNPFGNLKTLPSGILREFPENLERADLVVVSRANLCLDIEAVKLQIMEFAPDVPIFVSGNMNAGLRSLEDFGSGSKSLRKSIEENVLAFCGIGNPNNFFEQLRQSGVKISSSKAFPDHHKYTIDDVNSLEEMAQKTGADVLVTTAKDAVKLNAANHTLPCLVYETELVFENEKGFAEILDKALIENKLLTS